MTQDMRLDIGGQQLYPTLNGQCRHIEIEQRLRDGDVDMDGTTTHQQGLVDQTVAIPVLLGQTSSGSS